MEEIADIGFVDEMLEVESGALALELIHFAIVGSREL